jgi:hypothetical protein
MKTPAAELVPYHVGRGGRHQDLDEAAQDFRELTDVGYSPRRVMVWRVGVRSRFGLLRTLAFRDALMGKPSCFSWSRRMGCGKTSA